jgi:GT2 family glycosyltransferase
VILATIAVVTPTHQRRQSLMLVLDGLARQNCDPSLFSVVVVCDGCTDGTQAALRERSFPFRLTVLEQFPANGPASARNLALSAAQEPILLFLDDDVIPGENLIEVHAAHHRSRDDVVVIGPLLAPRKLRQPWIRWEADTLRKQYDEMQEGAWSPTARQFYTGNASVRREHVMAVGGFDARYRRGEDVDLAFRLQRRGLAFVFDPKAPGVHIANRTFGAWVDAAREYGRVELAMGPVWGERGLVDVKVVEFQRRNAIVRRTVSYGLQHPRAVRLLIAMWRVVARVFAAAGFWKLARGAYTAIFELAYWRGVDDAAGASGDALTWINAGRRLWLAQGARASVHR